MKRLRGGVVVHLTLPQFNAITTTLSGELESLTDADRASGLHDDLAAGLKAMTDARRRKQARRNLALEEAAKNG